MPVVNTKVVSAEIVAPNVIHLQIAKPEGYVWRTGEFARLGLKLNGEDVFRCYSIANTATNSTVDFFIARVKDGTLSPALFSLKPGDCVMLDMEVNGMLLADRLAPGGRDLWLFASGTGIAPFLAMSADSTITAQYDNIVIGHGVRTWAETQYVGRFVTRSPKLQVIAAVTREPGAIVNKRIPAALQEGLIERIAGLEINKQCSRIMLCGNPALVKAVREFMKLRDIVSPRRGNPGELLAENFWL